MMRKALPRVSIFVLLVLLVSPGSSMSEPPLPDTEDIGALYLVISLSPHIFGEPNTPSRALLITDPYEIRKVHALMTTIEPQVCTCGGAWSASFWASPVEVVAAFEIGPADRYDPRLSAYFHQLRDRPTHFVYKLTIPVDIRPEQVIDNLEELGLAAFLRDPAASLPAFSGVWIVVDEPDLEEIRQMLARELPYVIDVSKYDPVIWSPSY